MLRDLSVAGQLVSFDDEAIESLRQRAMERFLAAEPVGEEAVGILYGRREEGLVVSGWRDIERESPGSPAVPLTSADEAALRQLMELAVDGAAPVGWFRSRTRGMAALSPEDLAACQKLFEGRECLSVILRPSTQRPVAASLGFVRPGAEAESSQRGVRVSLTPPEERIEPAAEVPSPPVPPPSVSPAVADAPAPPKRRWLRPLIAFAVGVVLSSAAMVMYLDRPLKLDVRVNGPEVAVEWSRSAGFLTRNASASLKIGADTVSLSQSQFRQGRWTGVAPAGDFPVSLSVPDGLLGPRWAGVTVIRGAANSQ